MSSVIEEIPAYIHSYPNEFLACRDNGHHWSYTRVVILKSEDKKRTVGYEQEMLCTTCDTVRFRTLTPTGAIVGSTYRYAKGYLIHSSVDRVAQDRQLMRIERVYRLHNVVTERDES